MRFAIFFLAIMLVACGAKPVPHAVVPKGTKVVILGDSLSYGTGAKPGEDYPTQLAKISGWEIVNAGVPGDTSEGGLSRLSDLLELHQPQLLIVELGGNDMLRQAPITALEQNMKQIISTTKANGIDCLIVAIPEVSPLMAAFGKLSDHPVYEKIAQDTHTPLVQNVFSSVLSERELKADPIHPNAVGYQEVTKQLVEALTEMGYIAK